jgi:hypothetical protein
MVSGILALLSVTTDGAFSFSTAVLKLADSITGGAFSEDL